MMIDFTHPCTVKFVISVMSALHNFRAYTFYSQNFVILVGPKHATYNNSAKKKQAFIFFACIKMWKFSHLGLQYKISQEYPQGIKNLK